jgi:DNA-binding LytR/AlgR family response regulator
MALVRALPRRLQVVFTTAYSEYAVESYDLNAADYLLKPFLFERFAQAVLKAVERIKTPAPLQPTAPESAVMLIKSGGELHRLQLTDIVFCEAMKNYTKMVLRNGVTLCPLIPISRLEAALETLAPAGTFLRVHRSFLIPLAQAGPLGSGYVMVGGMYKIPVGQQFKAAVLQRLGG